MDLGAQNRRYRIFDSLNRRIELENEVNKSKGIDERKKYGQFSTPDVLAKQITDYVKRTIRINQPNILEPSCGSGAFIEALSESYFGNMGPSTGVEIDKEYFEIAENLYSDTTMFSFKNMDYFDFIRETREKFNLVISNPPYIRHQKLNSEMKKNLKKNVKDLLNINISGLADLYIPFILLSDKMIKKGGYGCWLIPSEFLSVNYGEALKQYLCNNVTLISIHRYSTEKSKFEDALVSSCVILYKKKKPKPNQVISFSTGDDINLPTQQDYISLENLNPKEKWMKGVKRAASSLETIGDYFIVKRGLATGDNDFFILNNDNIDKHQIDRELLIPIMPSPKKLKTNEISTDPQGTPNNIEQLFLLNIKDNPDVLKERYPNTWKYIQTGVGTTSERYLTKSRKQWYFQEDREPAPIVLAYMSRRGKDGTGYRFIRNRSLARSTNSYLLLYPKNNISDEEIDNLYERLLKIENDSIDLEGREYGGGLKKVEPKELPKVVF